MNRKIFLLLMPAFFLNCSSNYYSKEELNGYYRGIIDSVYVDIGNHSVMTFRVKVEDRKLIFIVAEFYPKSWKYATIGDSITKNKGESFITIKKNNKQKSFETRFKQP